MSLFQEGTTKDLRLVDALGACLDGFWIQHDRWPGGQVVRWTGHTLQLYDPDQSKWGPEWGIPSARDLHQKGWRVVDEV